MDYSRMTKKELIDILTGLETGGQGRGMEGIPGDRADSTEADLKRRVNALQAMMSVTNIVNQSLSERDILDHSLNESLRQMGVEAAAIYLLNAGAGELELIVHHGVSKEMIGAARRIRLGEGMGGKVALTGQPIVIESSSEYLWALKKYYKNDRLEAGASVPLTGSSGVIGVMSLASCEAGYFNPGSIELLMSMGRQIGVGIEKARLHQKADALALDLEVRVRQRTAELQESESKLRLLVNNIDELVYIVDVTGDPLKGTLEFISDQSVRILGYSPEEFLQGPDIWFSLLHPEDIDSVVSLTRQLAESKTKVTRLYRMKHKATGTYRWLEDRVTAQCDEQGNLVKYFGVARDITDQKRTEEMLHRSTLELSLRNRINHVLLTIPDEEMYTRVLEVILESLDSPYGVFGFLDEQGNFVVPTMTRTVWEKCQVPQKTFLFPVETWGDSSWPTAIRQKQSICTNEPSVKTPAGHIAITRHISMPLIHRNQVVGLIQVANKDSDYTHDNVELLETLGRIIAPVLDARLRHERMEFQRREAEQILKNNEQRFREILESLPQLFWTCRADGPCDYLSRQWIEYTGIPEAEQLGYGWLEQLHPDDRQRVINEWMEKVKTGEFFDIGFRIRRADGMYRWFKTRAVPWHDAKNQIIKWYGSNTDVDDLQTSLDAQRRLATIIESTSDMVGTADPEGRIIYLNSAGRKMLAIGEEESLDDKNITNFIPDRYRKFVFSDQIPDTLRDGTWNGEMELLNQQNREIPVSAVLVAHKTPEGKPMSLSAIARDITQRKQMEEQLKKNLEDLRRSNEELEQFAYVASHDLQEPLRMVASYTQLLEKRYREQLGPDAREFIYYAVDGATRMQVLINDLLEYSRVTTRGKAFEKIDISELLGRVIVNLKHKIQETKALITTGELPVISGDDSQILRVFQNLIDNALKFNVSEQPLVQIDSRPSGDCFIISVKDNGIGIEEQYKEKVFTIFQRLHSRKDYPGTGIGLAICKRIVERHGGKIWFESEPGMGTTFFFTFAK
jgi:PAS domain S-box-containing protein